MMNLHSSSRWSCLSPRCPIVQWWPSLTRPRILYKGAHWFDIYRSCRRSRHRNGSVCAGACVRVCVQLRASVCACVCLSAFVSSHPQWLGQTVRGPFINSLAPAQHIFGLYQSLSLSVYRSLPRSLFFSRLSLDLNMQIAYWVIIDISFVMLRNSTLANRQISFRTADVINTPAPKQQLQQA